MPFYTKEEKKELKGEYWEEDVKVKEEYGESTRQQRKREKYSGGSLWVGDLNLKEEDGGNGEKTDDRGRILEQESDCYTSVFLKY